MANPEPASLRVHRIERPSWSHTDLGDKQYWGGVYTSAEGLVRVDAVKPSVGVRGEQRSGYVRYDVIMHGVNISFYEPKYRSPAGVAIIAGRFVRMLAKAPRLKDAPPSHFENHINAVWQNIYGGKLST
jgi:hypothetical protein